MPVTIGGSGPITGVTSINTTVSDTELGYLDGVTSALQTQINGKPTGTTGAWTSWTPTITAGTGTLTSTTVNSAVYFQAGKLVICWLNVTITNAGTGAGGLGVTLPMNAVAARRGFFSGREDSATGVMLQGINAEVGKFSIVKYDNTTPIATNNQIIGHFIYEAA